MKKLLLLLFVLPPAMAEAQLSTWNLTTGTGDWFNSANWSAGVPISTGTAFIGTTGTAVIGTSGSTASANVLTVGGGSNILSSLLITSSGVLNTGTLTIGTNGNSVDVVNSSGTVTVGGVTNIGNGQSSGTLSISGGVWTNTSNIVLGSANTGTGVLVISSGSVSTLGSAGVQVGGATGAQGIFLLSGGTLQTGGQFLLGGKAGSVGTGTMSGGLLTDNSNFIVASATSSTGSFLITGGTLTSAGNAIIGSSSNSVGVITVTGGNWSNGVGVSGNINVGSSGNGTLVLSDSGTISAPAANTINIAVNVGSTGALDIGGTSNGTGTAFTGSLNVNKVAFGLGNASLNFFQSNGLNFTQTISGTGTVNQMGNGATTLIASNSYNGVTTIAGGQLNILTLGVEGSGGGVASSIGVSGNAASNLIIDSGTLQYIGNTGTTDRLFTVGPSGANLSASGSGAITFSNTGPIIYSSPNVAETVTLSGTNTGVNVLAPAITDNGTGRTSLVKNGIGVWQLSGLNTYTGGSIVNAGKLILGQASALGASSGDLTVNSGTLDLNGNNLTVGALSGTGAGLLTSGTAGSVTLTVNSSTNSSYAGSIQDGLGHIGLVKNGTGSLTLSGNNTFSGPTSINAGSLLLQSSLTNSAVTVGSGATLGGAGAAGATPVTISMSSLTLTAGSGSSSQSALNFNFAGGVGGLFDSINLTNGSNGLIINDSGAISLVLTDSTALSIGSSYSLITWTGTSVSDALFSISTNSSADIVQKGSLEVLSTGGDTYALSLQMVPEPSAAALVLATSGLLGGGRIIRRRFPLKSSEDKAETRIESR